MPQFQDWQSARIENRGRGVPRKGDVCRSTPRQKSRNRHVSAIAFRRLSPSRETADLRNWRVAGFQPAMPLSPQKLPHERLMKMSLDRFPIGLEMDASNPDFQVSLSLLSTAQLKFEIKQGPFARTEIVDIQVAPLGNSIFVVSWQEKDGATVTNIQDYDRSVIHSHATLPGGQFLNDWDIFDHSARRSGV